MYASVRIVRVFCLLIIVSHSVCSVCVLYVCDECVFVIVLLCD